MATLKFRNLSPGSTRRMNVVISSVEEAADNILLGFTWSASPEGRDYWAEVHARLLRIRQSKVQDNCEVSHG